MRGKYYFLLCYWWYCCTIRGTSANYFFPRDFLFAASTSAYQVEGAWNVDGKGENIWDRLTHTHPNMIKDGQNADDAAKSYDFYKNDSALLKKIGFNMYRLSISWTRILPNGDLSKINQAGIDHYNDVLNDLTRKKIQPMVIIYHWDLPQKLEDRGGWLNSSIVDHIANYADILFHHFGDRVKWWNTLNEPINIVKGYAGKNTLAPSLGLGTPADYIVVRNILLSHARIYRLYDQKYRKKQHGKLSITLDYETCFPKTESLADKLAVERYFQFMAGIFAHPIYSKKGDYPPLVQYIVDENSKKQGLKESRLPKFSKKEINEIRGTFDYFSLNHYTSNLCSQPAVHQGTDLNVTYTLFSHDMNVKVDQSPFWPKTGEPEMKVTPKGMQEALKKMTKEYNRPDIFITENGYSDTSPKYDYKRIVFFNFYLKEMLTAMHVDGCKVFGYTVWSLLDNFQWLAGYESKFGIISVNFNSTEKTRDLKLSAKWFSTVIKTRKIPNQSDWIIRS